MDISLLKTEAAKDDNGDFTVSRETINKLLPEGLTADLVDSVKNWESDLLAGAGGAYRDLLQEGGYADRNEDGTRKHTGELPTYTLDYAERGSMSWGGIINEKASIYGSIRTGVSETAASISDEIEGLFN